MYPLLHSEDVIYLKKISFKLIKTDDIICFKKYGKLQTHRVIYKTDTYIITKGDNNLKADGRVYPRQIIGRVYQVKRNDEIFNPEDIYLFQSTLYFQEIVKITKALDKAGIDYVFLKGLPLHLYFEKTHPRRLYTDCDILINKEHTLTVISRLKKLGYIQISNDLNPIYHRLKDYDSQLLFYKPSQPIPIFLDVHVNAFVAIPQIGTLNYLYPNKLAQSINNDLLHNRVSEVIQGDIFQFPPLEEQIIFLSFNLFRDGYLGAYRYRLLKKLYQKLEKKKGGYSQLLIKIKKYKLENLIHPSVILLRKYFNFTAPSYFTESLYPTNIFRSQIHKLTLIDIFKTESRIEAGTNRFKLYFYLSQEPLIKKSLTFIQPKVLYGILWVLKTKLIKVNNLTG